MAWTNRGQNVKTFIFFPQESVSPSSYVETDPISLKSSNGIVNIQPNIQDGTFDIDMYLSNFRDPSANHWSSSVSVAIGLTSSDTDPIPVDVNGVHLWVKFRATETSGTGSPAFGDGIAVCIK